MQPEHISSIIKRLEAKLQRQQQATKVTEDHINLLKQTAKRL